MISIDSNLLPFNVLFKARNQAVDSVFYDVSSLTFDEWLSLTPWVDRKGKIIVVSPGGAVWPDGKPKTIRHYESSDEFLASDDWGTVSAVAVAGVGSSVIGTAAMARNVADAVGEDVAGIVSGYGIADVILEGLGGWFFYGKMDQFRYEMQAAMEDVASLIASNFSKGSDPRDFLRRYFDNPLDTYVPSNPDVAALHDILLERYQRHGNMNLRLLVGHSKGNLLISAVLNHMSHGLRGKTSGKDKSFHNLAVVTLGSVVDLPLDMIHEENQYQFLGTLDLLGRMNSRSIGGDIGRKQAIPGVWHSLNTRLPGHMDLKALLKNKVKIPPPIASTRDGVDHLSMERSQWVAAAIRAHAIGN
jgi:hypothetical protein